jgi:pimeloyl-ACP methyl ester carboxylesterase
MMRRITAGGPAMLGCSLALSLSLAVATGAWAAKPPPPDLSQGDGRTSAFYTWDKDIPTRPGVLLRSEPLPSTLGLANADRQLRILYTSTDGVGGKTPTVVSGAVFLPKGTPPAHGWPLVAWAHGTFGMADSCAPSWHGRSYRDVRYLNAWLKEGYAVVATDYQGLGVPGPNPALSNRANAYAVLDSARAVVRSVPGLNGKVLLVGQSQGGAAVFAAAGYAPGYAPDLDVRGTVATGVMYRPPGEAAAAPAERSHKLDPTLAYQFLSVLAAQQYDPSLKASEILTDQALPLLEQARVSCLDTLEEDVEGLGLTAADAIQPGAEARLAPWWDAYQRFPTLQLKQPVFIGAGADDGLAPAQLALARNACAAGATVEIHLYLRRDHSGAVNTSLQDSLPFARKVIAGEPIQPICKPTPQ